VDEVEAGVRTATDDNASDGAMLLLLSLFGFIIAGYAFFAAFIALQIWLAATIVLRLCERKFVKAALSSCVLAFLVNIDTIWF
jgi:hypothetical protein